MSSAAFKASIARRVAEVAAQKAVNTQPTAVNAQATAVNRRGAYPSSDKRRAYMREYMRAKRAKKPLPGQADRNAPPATATA